METPIYRLTTTAKGGNRVWMKRDDFFPFSFGGNKARKAVHFFREIDALGADCVVSYGSGSSNHCRVVANAAAARGLECRIVSPEEADERTFNGVLTDWFGATRTVVPVEKVSAEIDATMQKLRDAGKKPFFIPGGGHGNLGTRAYVDCYEEILTFERRENVRFDYVFFASGTGTTQAGLVCGQLLNRDERKIVGISVARKNPRGRQVVLDSVAEYLEEARFSATAEEISDATIFVDDYVGGGYGCESAEIQETIRTLMFDFGVPTDATYTAKAFVGATAYLEKERIAEKNVLFIHTGGTPLFFDDLQKMRRSDV